MKNLHSKDQFRSSNRLRLFSENDRPKKSGLIVNFSDLGFHVLSSGNLTAEQMDDALDMLSSTVQSQEKKALYQLETCHETFNLYVSFFGNFPVYFVK